MWVLFYVYCDYRLSSMIVELTFVREKIMKKLLTVLTLSISLLSFNSYAHNHSEKKYEFVKSNNSVSTQICYTIVTGSKNKLKNKINQLYRNKNKAKRVMKDLECNDKSTLDWAAKYASADMKQFIMDRYYDSKIPKGVITIKDL